MENGELGARLVFHFPFVILYFSFAVSSPGIEPGPRPSQGRELSVTPQGRYFRGQGSGVKSQGSEVTVDRSY